MERRRHPRINEHFLVIVRGKDSSHNRFELKTETENLSAGGLYLHADRDIPPGSKLFFCICFRRPEEHFPTGAIIGAIGSVVRKDGEPNGCAPGIAVRFLRNRFF